MGFLWQTGRRITYEVLGVKGLIIKLSTQNYSNLTKHIRTNSNFHFIHCMYLTMHGKNLLNKYGFK